MRGSTPFHNAALTVLALGLLASSTVAQAQRPPQSGDSNAAAMEIISAWQSSSRGTTPQERVRLIESALALATRAEPWPFKEPPRDRLLGQMWGQLGNEYRRIEGPERAAAIDQALAACAQARRRRTPIAPHCATTRPRATAFAGRSRRPVSPMHWGKWGRRKLPLLHLHTMPR